MLPLFWYMLKVIICSGILFGYYWFFLRNKIFHQYNRFYLLASMVLSLFLPLLKINFWQPATQQNQAIRVLQAVSAGDEYMSNIVISAHKNHWSFEQLYTMVYCLVSIIFFLVIIRTLSLIRTLLKKYSVQQVDDVAFVNTEDDSTPFSFLKYIFWNSGIDINTTTGRQIFKHEVAHIQEKHTHDKLFVNVLLIFCWCNPFFWLYRKELNMIHEFIADKKAVEDSDTAAFAAMILQAAYPKHRFELTNNFFYSPIKRRLMMLTKNKNPRVNYLGRIMVLPLAILVFAAFTFKAKTNTSLNKLKSRMEKLPLRNKFLTKDSIPYGMFISAKYADADYFKTEDFKNKALVIVDSKEIGNVGNNYVEKSNEKYSTYVVYNSTEAKKIYGIKGKYGVIKLTQKDAMLITANTISYDEKSKLIKLSGGGSTGKGDLSNSLIYLEDKIISPEELNKIPPKKISSISILKGDKINDIVDAKGKTSVIYVSLKADDLPEVIVKSSVKKGSAIEIPNTSQSKNTDIADPKIYLGNNPGGKIHLDYLKTINEISLSTGYTFVSCMIWISGAGFDKNVVQIPLNSESLSSAAEYFNRCKDGAQIIFDNVKVKDKNGVQQILLSPPGFKVYDKDTEKEIVPVDELLTREKVFTQVEQNPQFTGGQEAWLKFLRANLKVNTPVDNGAKAGIYKVVLKFMVNADGSLSDIKCENDPGYGICAEAIRFIKTTPKWQPALQNGKKVNAFFKQPITFFVEDAENIQYGR